MANNLPHAKNTSRWKSFIGRLVGKNQTFSLRSNHLTSGYNYFINGLTYNFNTRNNAEYLRQGFGRNAYVYLVVNKIASIASTLPRVFKDMEGEEYENISSGSEGFASQMENPNANDSGDELYYKLAANLLITGNAILIAVKDSEGSTRNLIGPDQLIVPNIGDVQIKTDRGNDIGTAIEYEVQHYGKFAADDVLHIRFPNPIEESVWGLSPLHAGQTIYTASNELRTAQAYLWENRGVSGILSSKDTDMPMNPDEQERLQKNFNDRTAGSKKYGGVHVTSAAMQYLSIGMNATDLQLVQGNIEHFRDICRIYGVPPVIHGDIAVSTYNNVAEANVAYMIDVILPLCKKIDQQVSSFLLGEKYGVEDVQWCVDEDKVPIVATAKKKGEEEQKKVKSDRLQTEVNNGIITANEAREMLYPEMTPLPETETQEIEFA